MKSGLKTAIEYGIKLKSFKSLQEAEEHFLKYKDSLLKEFHDACSDGFGFVPDYSEESLKNLEKWYFELYENETFSSLGLTRTDFEKAMSIYFGEVVIRNNPDAEWVVEEFPFVNGKFDMGVKKGLMTMTLSNGFLDHFKEPSNKRRTSIYRKYNHYFSQ